MLPDTDRTHDGRPAKAENAATLPDPGARLARLRSQPRKAGAASFFWVDKRLRSAVVKVLPGKNFVAHEDLPIKTTLVPRIAGCLWDHTEQVGGMNHSMLPEGPDGGGQIVAGMSRLNLGERAVARRVVKTGSIDPS